MPLTLLETLRLSPRELASALEGRPLAEVRRVIAVLEDGWPSKAVAVAVRRLAPNEARAMLERLFEFAGPRDVEEFGTAAIHALGEDEAGAMFMDALDRHPLGVYWLSQFWHSGLSRDVRARLEEAILTNYPTIRSFLDEYAQSRAEGASRLAAFLRTNATAQPRLTRSLARTLATEGKMIEAITIHAGVDLEGAGSAVIEPTVQMAIELILRDPDV